MVAAIMLEKSDPRSARSNFELAVSKFDTFLQAVPPGPRFRDLVHYFSKSHLLEQNSLLAAATIHGPASR